MKNLKFENINSQVKYINNFEVIDNPNNNNKGSIKVYLNNIDWNDLDKYKNHYLALLDVTDSTSKKTKIIKNVKESIFKYAHNYYIIFNYNSLTNSNSNICNKYEIYYVSNNEYNLDGVNDSLTSSFWNKTECSDNSKSVNNFWNSNSNKIINEPGFITGKFYSSKYKNIITNRYIPVIETIQNSKSFIYILKNIESTDNHYDTQIVQFKINNKKTQTDNKVPNIYPSSYDKIIKIDYKDIKENIIKIPDLDKYLILDTSDIFYYSKLADKTGSFNLKYNIIDNIIQEIKEGVSPTNIIFQYETKMDDNTKNVNDLVNHILINKLDIPNGYFIDGYKIIANLYYFSNIKPEDKQIIYNISDCSLVESNSQNKLNKLKIIFNPNKENPGISYTNKVIDILQYILGDGYNKMQSFIITPQNNQQIIFYLPNGNYRLMDTNNEYKWELYLITGPKETIIYNNLSGSNSYNLSLPYKNSEYNVYKFNLSAIKLLHRYELLSFKIHSFFTICKNIECTEDDCDNVDKCSKLINLWNDDFFNYDANTNDGINIHNTMVNTIAYLTDLPIDIKIIDYKEDLNRTVEKKYEILPKMKRIELAENELALQIFIDSTKIVETSEITTKYIRVPLCNINGSNSIPQKKNIEMSIEVYDGIKNFKYTDINQEKIRDIYHKKIQLCAKLFSLDTQKFKNYSSGITSGKGFEQLQIKIQNINISRHIIEFYLKVNIDFNDNKVPIIIKNYNIKFPDQAIFKNYIIPISLKDNIIDSFDTVNELDVNILESNLNEITDRETQISNFNNNLSNLTNVISFVNNGYLNFLEHLLE
tara:strand:- start:57 stop:2510 length:2454 start_codon:yes stop_codon:yes gene_type:complete